VTSTTRTDTLSAFSNVGPEVDLAAPGSLIYSTAVDGTYRTTSGTSMAAPHVAGVGALLMAQGHSNTQARNRLVETTEDIGLSNDEQGHGLVNADAAIQGPPESDEMDPTVTVDAELDGMLEIVEQEFIWESYPGSHLCNIRVVLQNTSDTEIWFEGIGTITDDDGNPLGGDIARFGLDPEETTRYVFTMDRCADASSYQLEFEALSVDYTERLTILSSRHRLTPEHLN
jgi:hypothetical protein